MSEFGKLLAKLRPQSLYLWDRGSNYNKLPKKTPSVELLTIIKPQKYNGHPAETIVVLRVTRLLLLRISLKPSSYGKVDEAIVK